MEKIIKTIYKSDNGHEYNTEKAAINGDILYRLSKMFQSESIYGSLTIEDAIQVMIKNIDEIVELVNKAKDV